MESPQGDVFWVIKQSTESNITKFKRWQNGKIQVRGMKSNKFLLLTVFILHS